MSIYDHNNKKKKPQTTTNRNMVIYILIPILNILFLLGIIWIN